LTIRCARCRVQALPRGVRGHQYPHVGVLGEPLLGRAALFATDATVNLHDRLRAAEQRPDAVDEVAQRVAVLSEDDDLAQAPVDVLGETVGGEEVAQLRPLTVRTGVTDPPSDLYQVCQVSDLVVELSNGTCRGGGVHDVLFQLLQFVAGEVVQAIVETVIVFTAQDHVHPAPEGEVVPTTGSHLTAALLQPGLATLEAPKDRFGAGGKPALQDREREPDSVRHDGPRLRP